MLLYGNSQVNGSVSTLLYDPQTKGNISKHGLMFSCVRRAFHIHISGSKGFQMMMLVPEVGQFND